MNVLIVGANFANKGAQSMLFITVNEIRKRNQNAEIYFMTWDSYANEENYRFKRIFLSQLAQETVISNHKFSVPAVKSVVKDCIKYIAGKRKNLFPLRSLEKIMPEIDLILDISGFALGEKWFKERQEIYLNNIRLAKKYKIPIYLMPQSFGGFDYSGDKEYLLKEIGEMLQYPKMIFAREIQGRTALEETFHLKNVRQSYDLVLQNKGIDLSNIYKKIPEQNIPVLHTQHNMAIIPNQQCFNHGDKETNLKIYQSIIEKLISFGRHIYIFRHSHEDLETCKQIMALSENSEQVHLIEQDFSCFEYDEFVKNFDYIICSRFHGIVHAYRNYIPAIALGWEIKYQELTAAVGQEKYSFDITNKKLNPESILSALQHMNANFISESEIIHDRVKEIQNNNCFEHIEELKRG